MRPIQILSLTPKIHQQTGLLAIRNRRHRTAKEDDASVIWAVIHFFSFPCAMMMSLHCLLVLFVFIIPQILHVDEQCPFSVGVVKPETQLLL